MKTRLYIFNRFEDYLDDNCKDATVKSFCEFSNISRTTFYRFFQNIDDLVISFYQYHADKILLNSKNKTYYEIMYLHGELLLKDKYRSMILNYYKHNPNEFLRYVSDNFFSLSKKYYYNHHDEKLSDTQLFALKIYVKGAAYIILEILLDDLDYQLEDFNIKLDTVKPSFLNI
ncbi:TetR/AcrR family transcriptional regulator [Aerococcus urinae]|uniref:TetR/AcrR family transcriptional regulator n=1 Tax=Aerococcus TaxID=1375 RepID=UPI0018A6E3BD|nr:MULTISPECIES: TetR/AcrR family transcriptional regulator [Aerococcus]MCY3036242.1 TetR/AcrR family transcriptional regulator [Aerococcus sp. Group 2]MDK6520256.1 TetR/AcrR family transcriptional regulator [Aerococcus urinae]